MCTRSDIAYYLHEIREDPGNPWSSTSRELAEAVYAETIKHFPDAKHFCAGNYYICANKRSVMRLHSHYKSKQKCAENRLQEIMKMLETIESQMR